MPTTTTTTTRTNKDDEEGDDDEDEEPMPDCLELFLEDDDAAAAEVPALLERSLELLDGRCDRAEPDFVLGPAGALPELGFAMDVRLDAPVFPMFSATPGHTELYL